MRQLTIQFKFNFHLVFHYAIIKQLLMQIDASKLFRSLANFFPAIVAFKTYLFLSHYKNINVNVS